MNACKIKIPNGNFQNENGAAISGHISAVYLPNGDLGNLASWTATITDYCVSGAVTVSSAYLPATETCGTIDDNFTPCDFSGN